MNDPLWKDKMLNMDWGDWKIRFNRIVDDVLKERGREFEELLQSLKDHKKNK